MMPEDISNTIHWQDQYAPMSDEEIRIHMAQWKQHAPGWIAGDTILQRRRDHLILGKSKDSPLLKGRATDYYPSSTLSVDALRLLDLIWQQYSTSGNWPTTWLIHSKLTKSAALSALAELSNAFVIENPSAQGPIYQLQIIGILLTSNGAKMRDLLVQYLDYLRELYRTNPEKQLVSSEEARKSLRLSIEETALLGKLIFISGLFGGGGSQGTDTWSVGIVREIEDCTPETKTNDFLRQTLQQRFKLVSPISYEKRSQQLFTTNPLEQSLANPSTILPTSASNPLKRRYQVFVSSTFTDLKAERQEVMQALLQTKCIPVGMELFPAASMEQMALIKRVIDDSDYYIVIVGKRYGSVPEGKNLSYTEMEFDYAVATRKPILGFCAKNMEELLASQSSESDLSKEALLSFRDKVRGHRMCDHWTSAHELGSKVKTAILNAIEHDPQPGWVRATSVAPENERRAPSLVTRHSSTEKGTLLPKKAKRRKVPTANLSFDPTNLTDEAKRLLFAMSESSDGTVLKIETHDGFSLTVNSRDFVPDTHERRIQAKWERALRELLERALIEEKGGRGEIFAITAAGYEAAENCGLIP